MPATAELKRHADVLDALTDAARRCVDEGRPGVAAVLVQSAAGVAALRHPGRFACERLEAVLAGAARSLPDVPWVGGEGVLHVLSNAMDVGGHTRLAWRWMERDAGRRHSFVVARPAGPTPAPLVAAAQRSGGVEHAVPGYDAGLLATAEALRALGARHDLIVLHVQPNDPLASLAWADVADRPPILFCNHADHCFWLGRDVCDVVVGHRPVAADIAVDRRGLPRSRTATLALPLDDVARTTSERRAQARARIGIPPDARVLLTIGSSYKFEGGDRHLLDAVQPLVAADPHTLLLAVGPSPTGRWAQAAQATAGRVIAAGVVPDVSDVLAACDVFVESYPCSSGTAAVEAAQSGLPVVAWAPDAVEADLLGSAGAAAGLWPVARTAQELRELIEAAAADPDAVLAHHAPERWRTALATAEAAARALGPVRRGELAEPPSHEGALDVVLHHLHARTGHCHPLEVVDHWVAQSRALAAWPTLGACFVPSLAGATTHLELQRCFDVAVADPGPGEEGLAIEALRTLLVSRIAARGVLTLDPERVATALPALQAALADGVEVDLDVTPTSLPAAEVRDGYLAVRTPEDRFGDLHAPAVDATAL